MEKAEKILSLRFCILLTDELVSINFHVFLCIDFCSNVFLCLTEFQTCLYHDIIKLLKWVKNK